MEDVEMAQDEVFELQPMGPSQPSRTPAPRRTAQQQLTRPIQVFSGPMSESVPTSVSAFSHRRPRADSTASLTSFAYYDEEQDSDGAFSDDALADDDESQFDGYSAEDMDDVEAGLSSQSTSPTPPRRRSSGSSRKSVDRPLLQRYSSAGSAGSGS